MEVTAIAQEEFRALAWLCAFDYYDMASNTGGILFFEKKKKGSTFPHPKTETTILIHTAVSKRMCDRGDRPPACSAFFRGRVEGVRDDAGKKYELVSKLGDYKKEVAEKTHEDCEDVIIAAVEEPNKTMIALTSNLRKEVGDIKHDALINGEMMEFLGRGSIEAANCYRSPENILRCS